MTDKEFRSYRLDSLDDPTDEQLERLMENAARRVRESNRIAREKLVAELNRAADEAIKRRKAYEERRIRPNTDCDSRP